jgi:hypothetical protein
MNSSYGPNGGLPTYHLDWIIGGQPVVTRWDPCMYSPIHQDDINSQAEALLDAASVDTTIVNWAGDEGVSVQDWCAYMGELTGIDPDVQVSVMPGTSRGSVADVTKRNSITGPCNVPWKAGIKRTLEERYPDGVTPGMTIGGQASKLLSSYVED